MNRQSHGMHQVLAQPVINIDGVSYPYEGGDFTIYRYCFKKNINLPCFCYHEKLSIAGNCRICLVEANDALVASCAIPIMSGMKIFTDNKRVRKAREGILEFLLINHPLDCPICDQGGECDLQDISLIFGTDRGRFYETHKRSVDNLNTCGPFIKTIMTRCIHCTRCVRFLAEVCGHDDFGIIGRGSHTEIGTFVQNHLFDELSSNIIDLCPVGALTSMPYAFVARPWELSSFESVDVMDAVAASIRVDICNNKVVRILPCLKDGRNEEWLHNRSRFIYDSFNTQRNLFPRLKVYNKLVITNWFNALYVILLNLHFRKFDFVEAFTGPFFDIKSNLSLKFFFNSIGCSSINYQSNYNLTSDFRFSFLLNTSIIGLEAVFFCFFLGLNLRAESPLLNSRLRKSFLKNEHFLAFSIGNGLDYLTFPVVNLGNNSKSFFSLFEGKHAFLGLFSTLAFLPIKLLKSYNLVIRNFSSFIGLALISRADGYVLIKTLTTFINRVLNYNFYDKLAEQESLNIISNFLGRISAFETGSLPGINGNFFAKDDKHKSTKFLYLCGVDNFEDINLCPENFVIYQGSFQNWDFISHDVDILLPVSIYTEHVATFLNIEGQFVNTQKAVSPFKFVNKDSEVLKVLFLFKNFLIKENFSIIENFYFLSSFFKLILDYTCSFFGNFFSLDNVVTFGKPFNAKNFFSINLFAPFSFRTFNYKEANLKLNFGLINRAFNDYYSTDDQFSRNSKLISLSFTKAVLSNFSLNVLKRSQI
jgi:NADH-quinone oxidoreductase chain G